MLCSWVVVVVVAIDVTIEVLRKSRDLCVVFVCRRRCSDRSCDRGFAQKLRSLRCVRVSSLLFRPKLRSGFCAKVAIFVLYSCVVVIVVIAIELTIEILCKACDFLCGGGACVSFVFDLAQKLQSLCCGCVIQGFSRMYGGRENAYEREESEGHHHHHHHHHEREESEEHQHQPPYGREFEPRRGYAEEEVVSPVPYGYRPPVHEYGGGPHEEGERPAGFGDTTSTHHRKHDAQ